MNNITRRHSRNGVESEAVYSSCERYRYSLTRVWNPKAARLLFVMLNPSKATELANDATVERCERRAHRLGYGAMGVCNIFAWRETDPKALNDIAHPVGTSNDAEIAKAAAWADHILCAWGAHGDHRGQGQRIAYVLAACGTPLFALGLTKAGHPRHPLYVSYDTPLAPWNAADLCVRPPAPS